MPQVRTASRPVLASHSGGGFFVRRVALPGIVVVRCTIKPLARRARTRLCNKENVPPALERRSRLEDAAAQQQIQWIEDSSQSEDSTTPVQAEQNDPQSTLQAPEALRAVASGPGSTSVGANPPASVAEGEPKESSSPSDCSLQTVPSKPNDSAHADLMEKKLSRSIEQIEKMVNQRLKETPKAAQPSKVSVQRRTLMSMR
uniref:Uncharacterized protein n=1 Tax=Setaria italica TaxID=4555 RepID=K3YVU1_SETIT